MSPVSDEISRVRNLPGPFLSCRSQTVNGQGIPARDSATTIPIMLTWIQRNHGLRTHFQPKGDTEQDRHQSQDDEPEIRRMDHNENVREHPAPQHRSSPVDRSRIEGPDPHHTVTGASNARDLRESRSVSLPHGRMRVRSGIHE